MNSKKFKKRPDGSEILPGDVEFGETLNGIEYNYVLISSPQGAAELIFMIQFSINKKTEKMVMSGPFGYAFYRTFYSDNVKILRFDTPCS